MHQRVKKPFTPEQYLAMEERSDTKSEFYRGEIFAMAGASIDHNTIAGNVFAALHRHLRGKPCRPFTSDMRLLVQSNGLYTYPDVTVVCGEPLFFEGRTDTVMNPTLLIEVLSESTKDYDRGFKFELYRALTSLADYLLVDSAKVHVEHYHRLEDGRWTLQEYNDPSQSIELAAIDFSISIADLYERVVFAPTL